MSERPWHRPACLCGDCRPTAAPPPTRGALLVLLGLVLLAGLVLWVA